MIMFFLPIGTTKVQLVGAHMRSMAVLVAVEP
jgi:hypothetical protein